jgi:hypothetical protein
MRASRCRFRAGPFDYLPESGNDPAKESNMSRKQLKSTAFWVTTIFGPTSFVIGGVIGLMGSPEAVAGLNHLGYPAYFGALLGAWKLAGAITITLPGLPRLKEWAYAGFVFDLTAAAISHAVLGDAAADVVAPLGFLALVLASWALRPQSRTLVVPAAPAHAGAAAAEAVPLAA